MSKSMEKCKSSTKNSVIYRASLRGLKKCTSCGFINGQRALICRNVDCDLRIKRLAAIIPFDPIQLITYGHTKLYSLRSKEKLLQPRNFVSITECGTAESRSCIVCYVDNCKYDAFEPTHLVCRHIKACKVLTNVAVAEVYPIDKSILWNLNISIEQKRQLWDLYQLEEKLIHPVQKLNSSVFVVKCVESKNFPAGRLHVTVFSNKVPNKSGKFSCSCKKLKIMLESDNSVVMRQEICDHLLLLLSAVLNKPEGKTLYSNFLNLLQYLWMPTCLNTPIAECDSRPNQYTNYDLSLEKCSKQDMKVRNLEVTEKADDIFNFTEELFAENNIPDFSDIILNVNDKVSNIQNFNITKETTKVADHIKDPQLNSTIFSINDEDMGFNFPPIDSPDCLSTSIKGTATPTPILSNENGLNVIEQFQLNHNIETSNDNIELAKDIENLNNLEPLVIDTNTVLPAPCTGKQKSLLKSSCNESNNEEHSMKPWLIRTSTTSIPTFPPQKSIAVKIIKISKPLKIFSMARNSKLVQISQSGANKIITLNTKHTNDRVKQLLDVKPTFVQLNHMEDKHINCFAIPSLSYESWLDYVIENLNEKLIIQDSPIVENTFHVPQIIFNHFSKTFNLNSKRRLSHKTSIVKTDKYKGHVKYTWHFNQPSVVQRIFKSKNMIIELERSYQRLADDKHELYSPVITNQPKNNNFRTIFPKIQLYKVFIEFGNSTDNIQPHKCGLTLEWLPSAFPKSKFGLMTIVFYKSVNPLLDGTL